MLVFIPMADMAGIPSFPIAMTVPLATTFVLLVIGCPSYPHCLWSWIFHPVRGLQGIFLYDDYLSFTGKLCASNMVAYSRDDG